eukprot:TRINITY_DN21415_c0_g1_i1.p1 TRINITY_DN21415_c0_g1~~TRINITY_DN21415_c0_g1_i1.p1  ORF type:complete len:330 (+),score=110.58 TRINITY_DN21415_c0_g1_i1:98-991(+)
MSHTQRRPQIYLYNVTNGTVTDLLVLTQLHWGNLTILHDSTAMSQRIILFALTPHAWFNETSVSDWITPVDEFFAYENLVLARRIVNTRLRWWCDVTLGNLFPIAVGYIMLLFSRRIYTHMKDGERVELLAYLVKDVKGVFKSNLVSVVFGVWILFVWRYHVAYNSGSCTSLATPMLLLGLTCYTQSFMYPVFAFYIFFRGAAFMNRVRNRNSLSAFLFKQVDNAITTVQFVLYIICNIMLFVTLADTSPCPTLAYQSLAIMATSYVFLTFACCVMVSNGAALADFLPSLVTMGTHG